MSNHVMSLWYFFYKLSIKSCRGRGRGGSNMSSYAFGDSFAVWPKAKIRTSKRKISGGWDMTALPGGVRPPLTACMESLVAHSILLLVLHLVRYLDIA
jgi:hypothetical protein